jgi:outer membrane protein, heavy metal efflux system
MFLRFVSIFLVGLIAIPQTLLAVDQASEAVGLADSQTRPISLDRLIQAAKERNPEIIAAKAEWLAAKKRIWIDTSLPDPMAGYDIMGGMTETRVGPQEQRFMVSQEIPFPLKLYEKGKIASSEAKAAFQKYQAIKRDVLNDLTKFYYELYFVDASIETIEEIKEILKRFEGVAQSRYANLSGGQRDVAKAQAEVSMSLEKLFVLRQQRESIAAMINAIMDQDPMTELGRAELPEKPVLDQSLMELINLAVANRQEIKEMEAMVAGSKHKKRLAALQFIPDIDVGFQYTAVGSGSTMSPENGKDSWMFPLRINLPIWFNKNVPQVQEAQNMLGADRARVQAAKNTSFYEVKDAYYRFDSATKLVELYEVALIPQAKLALSSDQAGYEGGKSDFLNLLDSERVYLNAKLAYIRFLTESLKSYSDLARAAGLDLNDVQPLADEGENP